MPIAQTSQFDMKLAGPIEVDRQVETLNARNSILTGKRWEGMLVYVKEDGNTYILKGGLDNTYWELFGSGGVATEPTFTDDSFDI